MQWHSGPRAALHSEPCRAEHRGAGVPSASALRRSKSAARAGPTSYRWWRRCVKLTCPSTMMKRASRGSPSLISTAPSLKSCGPTAWVMHLRSPMVTVPKTESEACDSAPHFSPPQVKHLALDGEPLVNRLCDRTLQFVIHISGPHTACDPEAVLSPAQLEHNAEMVAEHPVVPLMPVALCGNEARRLCLRERGCGHRHSRRTCRQRHLVHFQFQGVLQGARNLLQVVHGV